MRAFLAKPRLVFFLSFLFAVVGYFGVFRQDSADLDIGKRFQSAVQHSVPVSIDVISSPFDEPFIPTTGRADRSALLSTLEAYHSDPRPKRRKIELFESYLEENPEDPWAPSVRANLALHYHKSARFTRALTCLKHSWDELKCLETGHPKALADRVLGAYAITLAHLGRYEELRPLLEEVEGRSLQGSATEFITVARESLAIMEGRPSVAFLCGPKALKWIVHRKGLLNKETAKILGTLTSTRRGTSLTQNYELSEKLGLNLQMAFREQGSDVLAPAVVHWKGGHFSAISEPDPQGLYPIQDETAGIGRYHLAMDRASLEEEVSGYFLVPQGPLPKGWRSVSTAEGQEVWGRGETGMNADYDATGDDTVILGGDPADSGPSGGDSPGSLGAGGGGGGGKPSCPMALWSAHASLVSLRLVDTPVGLSPAAFSVPFRVTYAHREINQPAVFDFSNFGPKWTSNWISYVTLGPSVQSPDGSDGIGTAKVYKTNGGAETFRFQLGEVLSDPGPHSRATLLDTDGSGYILNWPDGSLDEYTLERGSRWLLTARVDSQGNRYRLDYDAMGRLTGITDPSARVTSFSYDLVSDRLKITRVTDPFGRSANFAYTADGHLQSITDVIGITSRFEYGNNDFIERLVTPYGSTSFAYADINNTDIVTADGLPTQSVARILVVTDAEGRKHRFESNEGRGQDPGTLVGENDYNLFPSFVDVPDTEDVVPSGMGIANRILDKRNTFHWAPHQLDLNPDFNKATVYHFNHLSYFDDEEEEFFQDKIGRNLESVKRPLEARVWYDYVDPEGLNVPGSWYDRDHPTHVGRVLEDGTTQLYRYEYGNRGNVTKRIDPEGRVYDYTYDATEIDLESVTRSGQTLFSAGYDGNHNITSFTDSAGSNSSFSYDARGLMLSATNPLDETTQYTYNSNGNLIQIEEPLGKITLLSYDFAERVESVTDSEGYTINLAYDSADRPTQITYPDGTTTTFTYSRLDLIETKDRLNRITRFEYDGLRRPTQITDANDGITQMGYGLEDAVRSLTDPNGNTTLFQYDLQQRLIQKSYPDGATQSIDYETCTGRVKRVTDALGNSKSYEYFLDNQLKSIDYSDPDTPDVFFATDTFLPRPLSMTDGQGVTTMTYGAIGSPGANALASISGPYGDQATFTYDVAGRLESRIVNGLGESVSFDQLWRPTSTTNPLDTFGMTYLGKTGQVTQVSSSQGPTSQYAYTPNLADRRLAQIKNLRNNGTAISQFDYSYDPIGQISQMTKTFSGGGGSNSDTKLTASQDSILRAKKPHRNEGANPLLMLSHRPDIVNKSNNPIIDFDLTGIDVNSVTSAKLVLTIKECDIPKRWGKNGRFIIAQPITEPWAEGNGKRLRVPAGQRTRGTGEGVTWFSPIDDNISNKKPNGSVEWAGARTSLGPVMAPAVNIVNNQVGPIEFDVTQDVQSGFENGWIIRKQDEAKFGNVRFYSKEGAAEAGDLELAPQLILEFGGQGANSQNGGDDPVTQMLDVINNIWGWDTSDWEDGEQPEAGLAATASANNTETLDFRYDNLSQLIGVDINQTPHASYSFDPAGNMLSVTLNGVTTDLTYNSLNQTVTPGTNVFDPKGQTTEQDGRTFEWDSQGRVKAIVQGTQRSEFEYDGRSRRTAIQELEDGVVVSRKLYWWLGGAIVCERDGLQPGFPITKRYFGQGVLEETGTETTKLYYTLDHLGSVQELTDETGEVVADYRYSIYGERTKDSGDADSDFGFAGLFHHEPSGLDLATYRLYDSRQRRFISRDPLGEAVDYNLYRYANNNPVNFVDPEGLHPTDEAQLVERAIATGRTQDIKFALELITKAKHRRKLQRALTDLEKAAGKHCKGPGRSPLKTAGQKLDQSKSLRKAQKDFREGKRDRPIDSTNKSDKRSDHANSLIKTLKDALDEF